MKLALRTLILLCTLALSAAAFAHGTVRHELVRITADLYRGVTVIVNGEALAEPGFIYQDRTYLPVRAVSEALGANVTWDEEEKAASVDARRPVSADDPVSQADLAIKLASIRKATSKYQDIEKAKADGFVLSSGMLPNHGYHFIKSSNILRSTDLSRPVGLVYIRHDDGTWQLGAVEYNALLKPSQPLLPGGQWIQHPAACHYEDGNELIESNVFNCPAFHTRTPAKLVTWHPSVWTFHVWAFYPNPKGLTAGDNPLLAPFNVPGVDVEHHHGD